MSDSSAAEREPVPRTSWDRLADARPITELLRRPVAVEIDGFGVDYVSWGHYRPQRWNNTWHSHSFFEVCIGYAGSGVFRIEGREIDVGRGTVFVARPGDVHEIESSARAPLGIVFWGFALRALGRTGAQDRPGWWSGLLDRDAPMVSTRVGTLAPTLQALAIEAGQPRSGGETVINALAATVAVETGRAFADPAGLVITPPVERGRAEADVAVMLRYLQDNLARAIEVSDVAAQVHLSERHTQRVFAAVTGESVMEALRRLRLDQAAALLLDTELTVSEIARRCGYTDARAFGTAFGRRYGCAATAFRATHGTVQLGLARPHDPGPIG